MNLALEDIKKISELAQLDIDNELDKYTIELTNILKLIAQMDEIDTSNVQAMAHPLEIPQRLRTDQITEYEQRDLFQSIAPLVKDGLYVVPLVIE